MPSVFGYIPSRSRCGNVPNELVHRAGPSFLDNKLSALSDVSTAPNTVKGGQVQSSLKKAFAGNESLHANRRGTVD